MHRKEWKMKELLIAVMILITLSCYTHGNTPDNPTLTLPLLPHHTIKNRRRLVPRNKRTAPAYEGYGNFYVDLWVGKPYRQRQTVVIDTTTPYTSFPCSDCKDCGGFQEEGGNHTDPYYDFSQSRTFTKLTCDTCVEGKCVRGKGRICYMQSHYLKGNAWTGYEVRDDVYIGGWHDTPEDCLRGQDPFHASSFSFSLTFGCQSTAQGKFRSQIADGILGMSNHYYSFWRQMYEGKMIARRQFSLCFGRPEDAVGGHLDTVAGLVTFGGRNEAIAESPMVYALNLRNEGSYSLRVRNMYFLKDSERLRSYAEIRNKTILNLNLTVDFMNNGEVLVDSLSPDSHFINIIAESFQVAFKEMTGVEYAAAPSVRRPPVFPTILFQFEGDDMNRLLYDDPNSVPGLAGDLDPTHPYDVLIALPPSQYLQRLGQNPRSTFHMTEERCGAIGADILSGHELFFDIDGGRIGWAHSDCDYLLVEEMERNRTGEMEMNHTDHTNNSYSYTPSSSSSSSSTSEKQWKDTVESNPPLVYLLLFLMGNGIGIVLTLTIRYIRKRTIEHRYSIHETELTDLVT